MTKKHVILFGIILGSTAMGLVCRAKSAGTLIVVNSDEPGKSPYLFFEVSNSRALLDSEYIRLRVKHKKKATPK